MNSERVAVVLGARNLGVAIVDHLVSEGWRGASVALSEESVAAARRRGVLGIAGDASDPEVDQLRFLPAIPTRSARCSTGCATSWAHRA